MLVPWQTWNLKENKVQRTPEIHGKTRSQEGTGSGESFGYNCIYLVTYSMYLLYLLYSSIQQ